MDGGCEGRNFFCASIGDESFFVLVLAIDEMVLVGRSTDLVRATVAPFPVDELLGKHGSNWRDDS